MKKKPPPYYGTRLRSLRVEDDLWERAMAVARSRDEKLSEEVRKFLKRYVRRHGG